MASQTVVAVSFGAMLVLLAAVVGSVERRERFAFAGGVVAALAGLGLLAVSNVPRGAGAMIVLAGLVVVVASTVPLLFEQADV